MFTMGSSAAAIVVRSIAVYLAVIIGFRLMGKRELGQMTVFDLVVVLLIANAVQNAMVGPDSSLQGGLLAAAVLLGVNFLVASLPRRGAIFGRLLEGHPTIVIKDGHYLDPALRKERLTRDQLEEAMREHSVTDVSQVQLGVLEIDGSISIVPNDSKIFRTKRHIRKIRP